MRRYFAVLLFLLLTSASSLAQSTLRFPRVSFEPDELVGLAIVNPTQRDANVTLLAIDSSGVAVEADGFTNPVEVQVLAGQQFSQVTSEIFGPGPAGTVAWVEATSPVSELTGFFLLLDLGVTFFDGADLPQEAQELVFPEIRLGDGERTELNIVNGNEAPVTVTLELNEGGTVRSRILEIAGRGVARLDVAEFFEDAPATNMVRPLGSGETNNGSFVRVLSPEPVSGFQIARGSGDILGVNAQVLPAAVSTLFFPQLAVLPPFITELSLVSSAQEAAIVTITANRPDGSLYDGDDVQTNPATQLIPAGGSLRADLEQLFGFSGDQTLEGWIRVDSTSQQIQGTISYSLPSINSVATVPGVSEARQSAIFSHIATTFGFFTGVAALNSGALAANIRVVALRPDATVLGSFSSTLLPGQRISRLLSDIIPEAAEQAGGLIWVQSDVPIFLTSLFGSVGSGVLANIPPQPVPSSYLPVAEPGVAVNPPLAVLSPAGMQSFSIAGTMESPSWSVNGIIGGNAVVGTVDQDGIYTAPAIVPTSLPVTLAARAGEQTAGATIDVLARQTLVSGLGIVQSVAFLEGTQRLLVAELSALGTAEQTLPAGNLGTTILDVTAGREPVASFPSDDIPKMIPYRAVDGRDYLLLAAQTSGRILRLDPVSGTSVEVATGLNSPRAIVLDSTGNLLVAETDSLAVISAAQLNNGLMASARAHFSTAPVRFGLPVDGISPSGIAVDGCTGNVFLSDEVQGVVAVVDRGTGEIRTVAAELAGPGQLLAFQRRGVGCPAATHVLVVESRGDRVSLLVPSSGTRTTWANAPGVRDVAFLRSGVDFLTEGGVLLAEEVDGAGQVTAVDMSNLYEEEPINPPEFSGCVGTVTVQDPGLGLAIREALGLASSDPIPCEQAESLTALDASELGIRSLQGIQHFQNLYFLELAGNSISDIEPLRDVIRLEVLGLALNPISNFETLSSLTKLHALNLEMTGIRDLGPLEALVLMEELILFENDVRDLDPLASLIKLIVLDIGDNPIASDFSVLANFTQMRILLIDATGISDLTPLGSMPMLEELIAGPNPGIRTLEPILGFENLRLLDVSDTGIRNVAQVRTFTSLEDLFLVGLSLNDINGLEDLVHLTTLDVSFNELRDLGPISGLSRLQILGASGNQLEVVEALSTLTQLTTLQLAFNFIADVGPLSELTALKDLGLPFNFITDLGPLVANSGLGSGDTLDITMNPLDSAACEDISTLRSRGVQVIEDLGCP